MSAGVKGFNWIVYVVLACAWYVSVLLAFQLHTCICSMKSMVDKAMQYEGYGRYALSHRVHHSNSKWHDDTVTIVHTFSYRLSKYQAFKTFSKRILCSTDLFGRGIDIERVNIVFNYDMPENSDTYLHRVSVLHCLGV